MYFRPSCKERYMLTPSAQFQYMALVHYGQLIGRNFRNATRRLDALEAACSKERNQRRQLQSNLQDRQAEVERMRGVESKLKQWEARKPVITHYLGIFGDIMK